MTGVSKTIHSVLLTGWVLLTAPAIALPQETGSAQPAQTSEEPQQEEGFRRLHYIDVPVIIQEGIDPQMPAPPLPRDPELDPLFGERVTSISQYEDRVFSLESDQGVWSNTLIEELEQLGSLQQLQGDHVSAISTFDRAIHVNRINDGLYTLNQIPAVEKMIDSYIALDNWEQADLYNNYLYYVQQRAYGTSDPRIIPVLDRLANWHIQAFNVGYGEPLGLRLSSAQILFNAAARMVSVHFGREDERFVSLLRNLATTSYLASRYPEYMTELNRPEIRMTQDLLRQQLNEGEPNARRFTAGFRALSEVVGFYRGKPDKLYEAAEAIAHLADWLLIFERRRDAFDLYAEAWHMLAEAEDGEELTQRLFGQVSPIPAFMQQPTNLDPSSSESRESGALQFAYADLVFDVTAMGRVRNLSVVDEESADPTSRLNRLQREIRTSFFRPVIVDGEPVRSERNRFRYRYWY